MQCYHFTHEPCSNQGRKTTTVATAATSYCNLTSKWLRRTVIKGTFDIQLRSRLLKACGSLRHDGKHEVYKQKTTDPPGPTLSVALCLDERPFEVSLQRRNYVWLGKTPSNPREQVLELLRPLSPVIRQNIREACILISYREWNH